MVKFVLSEKFGGAISVDDLLRRDDRGTIYSEMSEFAS